MLVMDYCELARQRVFLYLCMGDCQARFREKGGVKLSSTYSTNEMETKDSIGKGEVILNQRQKVDA